MQMGPFLFDLMKSDNESIRNKLYVFGSDDLLYFYIKIIIKGDKTTKAKEKRRFLLK
jgi:hypothetical protein